jgi:hypothetical protein
MTWHSREVADEAISDGAPAAMIQGAKVLAMSCVDLFLNPESVQLARDEFSRSQAST